MIVGCYSLDLYCRNESRHDSVRPAQFTGRTFAACKRDAIASGWRFHLDGDVSCPRCVRTPVAAQVDGRGGLAKFARSVAAASRKAIP